MSGFSTYQANKIINEELVVPYASRFLALFLADPTDENLTANEISAAWYSRRPTGAFASPTTGSTTNASGIQFGAVVGGAITVSHWGIYDAATSGNLRFSDKLPTPLVFNVDDIPFLNPGDLSITLL